MKKFTKISFINILTYFIIITVLILQSTYSQASRVKQKCNSNKEQIKRDMYFDFVRPHLLFLLHQVSDSLDGEITENEFYNRVITLVEMAILSKDLNEALRDENRHLWKNILTIGNIANFGVGNSEQIEIPGESILTNVIDTLITEIELIKISKSPNDKAKQIKTLATFLVTKYASICNNTFGAIRISARNKQLVTLQVTLDALNAYYFCCGEKECTPKFLKGNISTCTGNTTDWLTCLALQHSINNYDVNLDKDFLSWIGWDVGEDWLKMRINLYLNETLNLYNKIRQSKEEEAKYFDLKNKNRKNSSQTANKNNIQTPSGAEWQYLIDARHTMTDIQWDELKKDVIGTQINWIGYVFNIFKCRNNKCGIYVYPDRYSIPTSIDDFPLGDFAEFSISKNEALSLKKHQKIEFEAYIIELNEAELVEKFLTVKLDKVKIIKSNFNTNELLESNNNTNSTVISDNASNIIIGKWTNISTVENLSFLKEGTVIFESAGIHGKFKIIDNKKIIGMFNDSSIRNQVEWLFTISDNMLILNWDTGETSKFERYNPDIKLGMSFAESRRYMEAAELFRKNAEKGSCIASRFMGNSYEHGKGVKQDYGDAIKWYKKASEKGDYVSQNILGWIYATCENVRFRDGKNAVKYAQMAVSQKPNKYIYLDTLAVAYARNNEFEKAVNAQKKAISIIGRSGDNSTLMEYNKRILLYQNSQTYP